MNATTLKTLYEAQLAEDIEPPVPAHVDERAIRWMRHLSRRMPAGELKEPNPSRVWIWSDLHLGHAESIMYFGRPFTSPEEMDDALFRSWQHTVAPGDTIICLGDVAIGGLSDNRLKRLRSAPGRKILVVGEPRHQPRRVGRRRRLRRDSDDALRRGRTNPAADPHAVAQRA